MIAPSSRDNGQRERGVAAANRFEVIRITSRASKPTAIPPNSVIKLTGAKSVGTGAESVCTDLKSLDTVPVSVLPPIVPALRAESIAVCWLNQRWDGMRTGYAPDLFDRIQRFSTSVSERLH
jgi:hypothetical protein